MEAFGLQMLLMMTGLGFVLFGKGVLQSRKEGDKFNFLLFFQQNTNRLALAGFGLLIAAVGLYFDPTGLAELLNVLPIQFQIGTPLLLGASIAGLVLIAPKNNGGGEG